MACPALPTCGLAVTESERSLPDINRRIRTLMTKLGFDEGESFVIRMTGELCCLPTSVSMISEHHVP
jgi:sulfite reductase (ferredoxin)